MWKDEYLSQLNTIIDLITKGDISNAKIQSADYFSKIRDIGTYDKDVWRIDWRSKVYDFGKIFAGDATWVLGLIEKENSVRGNSESLDFIHSEIVWNFFDNKNDYVKDEIKSSIKKYPANPEFHHSYSHILEDNGNFELAISESRHALSQEKENYIYLYTYTAKVKKYFDYLINNGKLEEAKKLVDSSQKYYYEILPFQKDFIVKLNNTSAFSSLDDRLKDHITISNRVDFFSKEINSRINFEQKRLIEVLGLFSAVLGFILTNITIGISNLRLKDMLILMISMAVTLIIFSVSISYLFSRKDRDSRFWSFLKQRRFWALAVLFMVLITIFYCS